MALVKRGKVWWTDFWWRGDRQQKSTRCRNKRDAEQWLAAYRANLAKGEVGINVPQKKKLDFTAAVDRYLEWAATHHQSKQNTLRSYRGAANRLVAFFGGRQLDEITKDLVEQYKVRRSGDSPKRRVARSRSKERRVRPATVNRDLAVLHLMFNHFVDIGLVDSNPASRIKKLKEDNLQQRVVSFEEEALYLAEASDDLRDFASVLLDTGMRPEELRSLKAEHVNFKENQIQVVRGKTKSARRKIAMTARVREILSRRFGLWGPEGAFINPLTERPIASFKTAHTAALRRSGVAPFRLYDLRHTFATRFVESGGDLATLQTTLGHSNLQMVMRYAHPTERHQFDCIRRMEQAREAIGVAKVASV